MADNVRAYQTEYYCNGHQICTPSIRVELLKIMTKQSLN